MARITKKDLEYPEPELDDWDKVLESKLNEKVDYQSEVKGVALIEDKEPVKTHVLSFRVSEYEYQKLMEKFGDASRLRDSLLSELKESARLERIVIREMGEVQKLTN